MRTEGARAIVVDDDVVTRSVISRLVEEHGARVMAEADGSLAAIDVIERFRPDLVVLDMALAIGGGDEVLTHLGERHSRCQVVVFTAFGGSAQAYSGSGVRIVEKPFFDDLERALDAALDALGEEEVATERRRPARQLAPPTLSRTELGLDDAADFYQAVADAHPGDALLGIPAAGVDTAALAQATRRAIRNHDRMILRGSTLLVLLVGGGSDGPPAVLGRLGASQPAPAGSARVHVLAEGDDPSSALSTVSG